MNIGSGLSAREVRNLHTTLFSPLLPFVIRIVFTMPGHMSTVVNCLELSEM